MRIVGLLREQTDLIFYNLSSGKDSVTLRGVPLNSETGGGQGRYFWRCNPLWDCKDHHTLTNILLIFIFTNKYLRHTTVFNRTV